MYRGKVYGPAGALHPVSRRPADTAPSTSAALKLARSAAIFDNGRGITPGEATSTSQHRPPAAAVRSSCAEIAMLRTWSIFRMVNLSGLFPTAQANQATL